MLSIEDCIAFCGLDLDELEAIAEHEHVPEIAAAALASYLLHQEHGAEKIRDMIVDDIRIAAGREDFNHAAQLFAALRHFMSEHPELAEGAEA